MGLEKRKLEDFSTTHERETWDELVIILEKEFSGDSETSLLLGNLKQNGKDWVDAIFIKKDAIVIIDFKEGKGKIEFSENGPWKRESGEQIKGGSSPNPLKQLKYYKYKVKNHLNSWSTRIPEFASCNLDHINGVVLFRERIEFDEKELPGSIRPWFHICDFENIGRKLRNITLRTVKLSEDTLKKFAEVFGFAQEHMLSTPVVVNRPLSNANKQLKPDEISRILDYYVSCLQQEDMKQLTFKANLDHGGNLTSTDSYHILPFLTERIMDDDNVSVSIQDNILKKSIEQFVNSEEQKTNPRTLFWAFGYAVFKQGNNPPLLYPKYYLEVDYDNQDSKIRRSKDSSVKFNSQYLIRSGITEREERELLMQELDSLNEIVLMEKFLEENGIKNPDTLKSESILFYSESSEFTKSLIKELGENGLLYNSRLNNLQNSISRILINKDRIDSNQVDYDRDVEIEIATLNQSQSMAVRRALSQKLSVVTGPPGTGKSQVVLNILANAITQGKTVLFASKNNKAVDVVHGRMNYDILDNDNGALQNVMPRIGNKDVMNQAIQHLANIVNGLGNQKFVYSQVEFQNTKDSIKKANNVILALEEKIKRCDEYSKSVEQSKSLCYGIRKELFAGYKLPIPLIDLEYSESEIARLSSREKCGFIEKLIINLLPKYYFKKYYKKFLEYKSKLSEEIQNCIDKEEFFKSFDLKELGKGYLFLVESKKWERSIALIREFILQNDLDQTFRNDDQTAINALSKMKEKFLEELHNALMNRRIVSRDYFRLLIEKNLENGSTTIGQYRNDINQKINFSIPSQNFAQFMRDWETHSRSVIDHLPIWTVTNLSVANGFPLLNELFDLLLIDEASQCDIASAIPLFYRAKSVCIIGDDLQLKHISGISIDEDYAIADECGVPQVGGRYTEESLFDRCINVSLNSGIGDTFLEEHFRSSNEIMEFSNLNFYLPKKGVKMIHKTPQEALRFHMHGIYWIDVDSDGESTASKRNENEADKIFDLLTEWISSGKIAINTVGIATPFRNQEEQLKQMMLARRIPTNTNMNLAALTVNKFQGDERDVIFFSPVISKGATAGMKNFINYGAPQLLNVAISRARSALIVVGDKRECINSGGLLRKLAEASKEFRYP